MSEKIRGNPFYMEGLRARRMALLNRLRGSEPDTWDREMNRFALQNDLRIEKVKEYYTLLIKSGYLEKNGDGEYESVE